MYAMEPAISTSTSGGNQSAVGAKPSADATSVTEWATVKAVLTPTSGRTARLGSTRQRTNNR